MSKASKISLFVSLLALIGYGVTHVLFGSLNGDFVLLGTFALSIASSIFFDRALWAEFLTMRTTKHGMNMGVMILLMFAGVVCVNYLALKHNKTWDLTKERLNSLSEQSTKLLDGLQDDLKVNVYYDGGRGAEAKTAALAVFNQYKDYSGKVRITSANSMVPDEETLAALKDQPDFTTAPLFAFVDYKGKRIRVGEPIDESSVTSAIIRATRTGDTVAYFVKGHGEVDLSAQNEMGASELEKALKDSSFKIESLDLVGKTEVPADAALVAILGPKKAFLEDELKVLRDFAKRGGHLLVAIDPGTHHNLANLTKPLGVEFTNTYVGVGPRDQLQNGGPFRILGRTFDPHSPITTNFPPGSSFTLFSVASELKVAHQPGIETTELVKSVPTAVTITDVTQPRPSEKHAATLGIAASGQTEGASGKKFELVVFGDSDFFVNQYLAVGSNRDLILNAFAHLANQKDLISIKPKLPAGTTLVMTPAATWIIVILVLLIPLGLIVTSLVIWFRRRGA